MKSAAFLLISSLPFSVYTRNILYICCNIISFKSLVSYSFICYLQGLDSFFDYKDTTFKGICQEIHLIKYLLQAFIKSIVLLLLTFYATKQYQFYERHSLTCTAAIPAASPVTRQGGITRKLPKASSSVEIQRPATNRFFNPLGVRQR